MGSHDSKVIKRMIDSPLFPFTGDVELKTLTDPMGSELPREGEGGRPCETCRDEAHVLWRNDRWKVTSVRPSANPVGLFLETVEHIDFEHFDDDLAADFGRLTWHLEAAIRSLDSVGRVHIHRWGDGAEHFHVWFQGRPARQLELYGWGNVLWAQLLEPLPTELIDANHAAVVEYLRGAVGGEVSGPA